MSNTKKFLMILSLLACTVAAYFAGVVKASRNQAQEVVLTSEQKAQIETERAAKRELERKEYAKAEALEEQQAIFYNSKTFSICSPDGVAYWSRYGKWDSRSSSFTPRFGPDGKVVRCDFKTNELIAPEGKAK